MTKQMRASIRAKIKRLLRRHGYTVPKGGAGHGHGSPEAAADLILDQARTLYRTWPEVWQGEFLL